MLIERAARGLLIPPRLRGLIGHGVALGEWALSAPGQHAIALAGTADPTGRLLELGRLLDCGGGPEGEGCDGPRMREATALLRVARAYVAERRQGAAAAVALARAMDAAGNDLEAPARQALATALKNGRPARTAV